MAYFWQFSFCIHTNIQVFIWKRLVSIFTDHWGEIKKKPLTLIISKLCLARRSALSTFLREADIEQIIVVECDQFVTDRHFQKFQSLKACEK